MTDNCVHTSTDTHLEPYTLQLRQVPALMIGLVHNESKGEQSNSLAVEKETNANEQEGRSDTAKSAPGRERTSHILDGLGERTHEGESQGASESVDDDQSRCSSRGVRIQQGVLRGDGNGAEAEVERTKDVDLGEPVNAPRVGLLVAMQNHGGETHCGGNEHWQDSDFRLVHSLSLLGKVLDEEVGKQSNEGDGQEDVHHGAYKKDRNEFQRPQAHAMRSLTCLDEADVVSFPTVRRSDEDSRVLIASISASYSIERIEEHHTHCSGMDDCHGQEPEVQGTQKQNIGEKQLEWQKVRVRWLGQYRGLPAAKHA